MKTIRRIYFYLVTFISVLSLTWGITNLLRSVTNAQIVGDQSDALSTGLAQILVSIPIFLFHWHKVQQDADKLEEEKNSSIRGVYFYSLLLASLIPVFQNLIALLNRLLLQASHLNPQKAIFGGYQTLSDNLIAITVNLILAVYFSGILKSNWASATDTEGFTDLRRLYRYIWMLYSLGLTIIGAQKLLEFIFTFQPTLFPSAGKEQFSNGLTLLLIGAPLWLYWWRLIQSSIYSAQEIRSLLRTLVLYILLLTGACTFSINMGGIIYWLLRETMGEGGTIQNLLSEISTPFSLALIFGVIWAYFSRILKSDISSEFDPTKQAAMHRIYRYILAGLGLAGTIFGIAGICELIIDLLLNKNWIWQDVNQTLAQNLAVLIIGTSLWFVFWRKVNYDSMQIGEIGDHARRSLSRKIYLFLVIFACVIGVMASTGLLVYNLLQSIFGTVNSDLLNLTLQYARLILLFAAFLIYHLNCLRRDNRALTTTFENKQAAFPVVAFLDPESIRGKGIQRAFQRHAEAIPLTILPPHQFDPGSIQNAAALVLESDLLEDQTEKFTHLIKAYSGKVIILPAVDSRFIWINSHLKETNIHRGCAQTVRSLSEGQTVKTVTSGSPWLIIVYIIAALTGLQILASILMMAFSR